MGSTPTDTDLAAELFAQNGLTPRQRRLLHLRRLARGKGDELVELEGAWVEAAPWHRDTHLGRRVPAQFRKPKHRLGIVKSIVRRLSSLAAGGERFARITVMGPEEAAEELRWRLLEKEGLDLPLHGRAHVADLVTVGASIFGFVRGFDADGEPFYEHRRWPVEWVELVKVEALDTPRARQLAAEIFAFAPELVEKDNDGRPRFKRPKTGRGDAIAFARYEYLVEREGEASIELGSQRKTERVRVRRDFTVDAIVDYHELVLEPGSQTPAKWEPLLPVEPHEWGLVPMVHVSTLGAEHGELEGDSLIEGAVEELAASANRSASILSDGAWAAADQTLYTVDLEEPARNVALEAGDPEGLEVPVGGKHLLEFKSHRERAGTFGGLEVPDKGLERLAEELKSTTHAAWEAAGVARHDPERVAGVMSGIALEIINAPTLAEIDEIRGILSRGYHELADKLEAVLKVDGGVIPPGVELTTACAWPRVFPYTAADQEAVGNAIAVLKGAGVISQATAVRMAAAVAGVEDVDAEIKAIETEKAAAVREALAMAGVGGDPDDEDDEELDDEDGEEG